MAAGGRARDRSVSGANDRIINERRARGGRGDGCGLLHDGVAQLLRGASDGDERALIYRIPIRRQKTRFDGRAAKTHFFVISFGATRTNSHKRLSTRESR